MHWLSVIGAECLYRLKHSGNIAARGGRQSEYPWGDTLLEGGYYHANTWQGRFPYENTGLDGFIGTAPVYEFLPNDFGLYQMIGNVWEWCRNPRYTLLASFNEDDYELGYKRRSMLSEEVPFYVIVLIVIDTE